MAILNPCPGAPSIALAGTRLGLYRQALELFQHDMPFVPLFHSSIFTVHRTEVRGLVLGPTGILRFDKTWKQP